MFIFNETPTVVIHFDSLSLTLTVMNMQPPPTHCILLCDTKEQFIILTLTPAPKLSDDLRRIYRLLMCIKFFLTVRGCLNLNSSPEMNYLLERKNNLCFLGNMVGVLCCLKFRHQACLEKQKFKSTLQPITLRSLILSWPLQHGRNRSSYRKVNNRITPLRYKLLFGK